MNHEGDVSVLIEVSTEGLQQQIHQHDGDTTKANIAEPPIPLDADLGALIQHETVMVNPNAASGMVVEHLSQPVEPVHGVSAPVIEGVENFSATPLVNMASGTGSGNFLDHADVDAGMPTVAVKLEPSDSAEDGTGSGKRPLVSAIPPIKRRKYSTNGKKATPRWNDMLFTLLQYRSDHGNCMVPFKSGGELGKWVATQRAQYLALQKNRLSDLPEDSAPVPQDDGDMPPDTVSGEANVNQDDPSSTSNVAGDGTNLDSSEALNADRIKVLTSIGFVWDVVQADNDARWRKRFEELVEYKSVHNHCNVPQSTDLGKWVKMQRENKHETDLKKAGKTPFRKKPKPCLSEERISKLESIGFQWRVAKPAVGWDNRFQQLVEYKAANGDCNVPQSYPHDKPFGRWVMKQRCQQSLKLRGEKSQLTDEREAKLTALGFCWVAPGFSKKTVTLPGGEEDATNGAQQESNLISDTPSNLESNSAEISQNPEQHVVIQVMNYPPDQEATDIVNQELQPQPADAAHLGGHEAVNTKMEAPVEQSTTELQAAVEAPNANGSVPESFTTWTV